MAAPSAGTSVLARYFNRDDLTLLVGVAAALAGALGYAWFLGAFALTMVVGLTLFAACLLVALLSRGGGLSQIALPVLGMLMVGVLIQADLGRTVAHFAVFAMLGAAVVYRNPLSVLASAATIALHHALFNYLQSLPAFQIYGWAPLCFTAPSWGAVVEHAIYVVVESLVLIVLTLRASADFRAAQQLEAIARRVTAAQSSGVIELDLRDYAGSNAPAVSRMLAAFAQVASTVDAVRVTSHSVTRSAQQLAEGNGALSQRSQSQRESLAQASSLMDQMIESVRASAARAEEASGLGRRAHEHARHGQELAAQSCAAMQEISQSSEEITRIAGLIDEIAFQTNLLALNAAVEAARAGEQGCGFSVVAAEVRQLAQRSSSAAREVKSLMGDSAGKVAAGTHLAERFGRVLEDIVDAVSANAAAVGDMERSGVVQTRGIEQLGQAIGRVEQITQQNVALVEQATDSADTMRRDALALSAQIACFHLVDRPESAEVLRADFRVPRNHAAPSNAPTIALAS